MNARKMSFRVFAHPPCPIVKNTAELALLNARTRTKLGIHGYALVPDDSLKTAESASIGNNRNQSLTESPY